VARRDAKRAGSQDIWHLDIDDLLGRPGQPEQAQGPGPFVITLRTSSTPITVVPKALPRFEALEVYQLQRELGTRSRFRLCIGLIETELEADAILALVRELYPRARRQPAQDDDRAAVARKAMARAPPKSAAHGAGTARPDPQPSGPFRWDIDELLPDLATAMPERIRQQPLNPPKPASGPEPKAPPRAPPRAAEPSPVPATDSVASSRLAAAPQRQGTEQIESELNAVTDQVETLQFTFDGSTIEGCGVDGSGIESARIDPPATRVTLEPETAPTAAAPPTLTGVTHTVSTPAALAMRSDPLDPASAAERSTGENVPRLVSEPVRSTRTENSASSRSSAQPPTRTQSSGSARETVRSPARPKASLPAAGATATPRSEGRAFNSRSDAPAIDSTQTIRVLTALELSDDQTSCWFAIQLALSERPIDPREVPNLGIFAEYRLYTVSGLHQDRDMHALRLGFFSSESAAEAVAGYLAPFFDAPCVKRVSTAEQERFEERSLAARKNVGELGEHAVIELAGPAVLPQRRARAKPEDTAENNGGETTSLWSRLLAARKR
jgi:hypothetical protein